MRRLGEEALFIIGKDLEKKVLISCQKGFDSFFMLWLSEKWKAILAVAEGILVELKDHLYYTYKISGG